MKLSLTRSALCVFTGAFVVCACPLDQNKEPSSAVTTIAGARSLQAGVERCGTPDFHVSKIEAKILGKKIAAIEKKNLDKNNLTPVTIDVAFRVIYDGDNNVGNIPDQSITDQIQVLNNSFSTHNFQFSLRETIRIDNAGWYYGCDDESFKAEIRDPNDGPEVLYFYTCSPGVGLLGYATFPTDAEDNLLLDGVVCLDESLPGGSGAPFNLGDTGTHEVGHWFGLLHTFQGGCDGGDYVDDTPAQAQPTSGCPAVAPDTCPATGLDPFNNFMDYSDDLCLLEFTTGQAVRMQAMWEIFRSGGTSVNPPIELTEDVLLTGQQLQVGTWQSYTVPVPLFSQVSVSLSGSNGDADLFAGLCSSISTGSSNEACTDFVLSSPLQIQVFAASGFTDLSIVATVEDEPVILNTDDTTTISSLDEDEFVVFRVQDVPIGSTISVETMGNNGDADLYLFQADASIFETFDLGKQCYAESGGSNEECEITLDSTIDVYILVFAYFSFTDLTLIVDVEVTEVTASPSKSPTESPDPECNFIFAFFAFLLKILTLGLVKFC